MTALRIKVAAVVVRHAPPTARRALVALAIASPRRGAGTTMLAVVVRWRATSPGTRLVTVNRRVRGRRGNPAPTSAVPHGQSGIEPLPSDLVGLATRALAIVAEPRPSVAAGLLL